LRFSFHLIILLFSLLFAAEDYHAGYQKDVSALCETELSWQENACEPGGVFFPADLPWLSTAGFQPDTERAFAYRFIPDQGRSFTPFPDCRLYLQYHQLRTDC
jgi:hypothetical protein